MGGGRTKEQLEEAQRYQAVIADIEQIHGLISKEKATKSDFERAMSILSQVRKYNKSKGITEFKYDLESIENTLKELIRLWGTPLFQMRAGFQVEEIKQKLKIIVTNLRKILKAI